MSLRPRTIDSGRCVLIAGLLVAAACPFAARATPAAAQVASLPLPRPPVPGAPAGVTAFVGVNVIPMDTERVLANQTVLVQHGWITQVGPAGQVAVPAGATRIDGQGKFLLPGLADMHTHIGGSGSFADRLRDPTMKLPAYDSAAVEDRLFLWLAQGITTVRNLDYVHRGTFFQALAGPALLRLRARAAAGTFWSPRIYTSGPWGPADYIRGSPVQPWDSVAAYVAAYQAAGYGFLKMHDEAPLMFDSVTAAARRIGLSVVGHVPPRMPLEHWLAFGNAIGRPLQ